MTTVTQNYGGYTDLTVTNLQSLVNSGGWQSDVIDNLSSVKAIDYEIFIKLTTANTAPANDKAVYVYVCEAIKNVVPSWLFDDSGSLTYPTGVEGTAVIASVGTNLRLLGVMPYVNAAQVLQSVFKLSNAVGSAMPDGFSIMIFNYSGAALATGCVVGYKAIKQDIT